MILCLNVYVLGYLVGTVEVEAAPGLKTNVGTVREVLRKTVRTERVGGSVGGWRFKLCLEWSPWVAANPTFKPGGWFKPDRAAELRAGKNLGIPTEVCTEILKYFPEQS